MADAVDRAQRALLRAIPTSRDPGIPLPSAITLFRSALAEASTHMEHWTGDDIAELHERCRRSIAQADAESARLLAEGPLSFEALNARVGDVLHPLEELADAERQLRKPLRAPERDS